MGTRATEKASGLPTGGSNAKCGALDWRHESWGGLSHALPPPPLRCPGTVPFHFGERRSELNFAGWRWGVVQHLCGSVRGARTTCGESGRIGSLRTTSGVLAGCSGARIVVLPHQVGRQASSACAAGQGLRQRPRCALPPLPSPRGASVPFGWFGHGVHTVFNRAARSLQSRHPLAGLDLGSSRGSW